MWFHRHGMRAVVVAYWPVLVRIAVTTMVAVAWVLISGSWLVGNYRIAQQEAGLVTMEMFIAPDVSADLIVSMKNQVQRLSTVSNVSVLTEEYVWTELGNSIGTSEDLRSVVSLPKILRITVKPEYVGYVQLTRFGSDLSTKYAELCTEVVWPRALVSSLDIRRDNLITMGVVLGGLTMLVLFLIYTHLLRSVLQRASEEFVALTSRGARIGWIVFPHLVVVYITATVGAALGLLAVVGFQAVYKVSWMTVMYGGELLSATAISLGLVYLISFWQHLFAVGRIARVRRPR